MGAPWFKNFEPDPASGFWAVGNGGLSLRKVSSALAVLSSTSRTVDDPKVRQPDITRAKTILGWEPKVTFEEGIKKTIDYFRGRLK